jgi:serine/threonine protein kinase
VVIQNVGRMNIADVDFNLQRNIIRKKNNKVIEKFVNAKDVANFDYASYIELSKRINFLVPVLDFKEVIPDKVYRFDIEIIDGIILDTLYIQPEHFCQLLHYLKSVVQFSKEKTGSTDKIFFHKDISIGNILLTKSNQLILIDPDSCQWGSYAEFLANLVGKYPKWLNRILTDK